MSDVLIRDVPEDVVGALDARAARLGLSRTEFLRRLLTQQAGSNAPEVSSRHLRTFAVEFADLADPHVMAGAWE
jgi:plasmid stability protein